MSQQNLVKKLRESIDPQVPRPKIKASNGSALSSQKLWSVLPPSLGILDYGFYFLFFHWRISFSSDFTPFSIPFMIFQVWSHHFQACSRTFQLFFQNHFDKWGSSFFKNFFFYSWSFKVNKIISIIWTKMNRFWLESVFSHYHSISVQFTPFQVFFPNQIPDLTLFFDPLVKELESIGKDGFQVSKSLKTVRLKLVSADLVAKKMVFSWKHQKSQWN